MMPPPTRVFLQQRVIPVYRQPFLEALAAHPGIDLTVFAGQPRSEEMIKTANYIEEADFIQTKNIHILKGGFYFCYQKHLLKALNEKMPHILIMEGNARYISTRLAFRWAKKHQASLIGWGLGVPHKSGLLNQANNILWLRFLENFYAMIAYSADGAAQYQYAGFTPEQVFTAINATTHRPTKPPPARPDHFPQGKANLLYVGRLQARKRLDRLMHTCAELPAAIQPNLWIVGDGPIRDELESTAKSSYPNTKFFGPLYGETLDQVFREADLFILPGTGGLAAQQAMSHALPVIMAAGDGTQSSYLSAENGWAIPANDDHALRETLKNALSDPTVLRKKGLNAFQTVKDKVNIEKMVETFSAAIRYTQERPSA